MLVSTVLQPTSFYAFLHDTANPLRGFAYHVNYIEVKTYDDGAVAKSEERQCNMAKAVELGLDLGPLTALLNTSAQATKELAVAELSKKEQELEAANEKLSAALQEVSAMASVVAESAKGTQ